MIKLDDLPTTYELPITQRIQDYCRQCIGLPYIVAPCGEGEQGDISQVPLYRFDGFDCMTFVNTILACGLSDSQDQFERWIRHLSYTGANVSYLARRHFVSIDWNPDLAAMGVLSDITRSILIGGQPCYQTASALINRSAWCRRHTLKSIKTSQPEKNRQGVLEVLHQQASTLQTMKVEMDYLPLQVLLRHTSNILTQLPAVGVVEVMREPSYFKAKVGTEMHVSHIGILVDGTLYHASTDARMIVALPLEGYFQKMQTHQQVIGLHVHALSESHPKIPFL